MPQTEKFQHYSRKVAGTNIDANTLLSTDYFNTFNSAVMILDMLPEAPELIEEIEQWRFYDYAGHFRASGLDFAALAVEAYDHVPPELRARFERKIEAMRVFLEDTARALRHLHDAGEFTAFAVFARAAAQLFRCMIAEGSAIIHGQAESLDQSAIDKLF